MTAFLMRAIRAEEDVAADAARQVVFVAPAEAAGLARLSDFLKAVAHVRREA